MTNNSLRPGHCVRTTLETILLQRRCCNAEGRGYHNVILIVPWSPPIYRIHAMARRSIHLPPALLELPTCNSSSSILWSDGQQHHKNMPNCSRTSTSKSATPEANVLGASFSRAGKLKRSTIKPEAKPQLSALSVAKHLPLKFYYWQYAQQYLTL